MSALLDTYGAMLLKAIGVHTLYVLVSVAIGFALGLVFGNQGEEALARLYPRLPIAQMSNYVGFSLDAAAGLGYERLLMAGHPGKLAKVAAGVMQTHSRYGDARREAIMAHLALMGAEVELLREVRASVTTDAALGVIARAGCGRVWGLMADSAQEYCEARVRGACRVDVLYMDAAGAPLGASRRLREDDSIWKV